MSFWSSGNPPGCLLDLSAQGLDSPDMGTEAPRDQSPDGNGHTCGPTRERTQRASEHREACTGHMHPAR